jgi:hypothetical protein
VSDGELPAELEQAVDDVLVSVHSELRGRDRLARGSQSSLGLVAELSESIGSLAAIVVRIESDRLDGHPAPEHEREGGEPRWLDSRDELIGISTLSLEACYLHAIHHQPKPLHDAGDVEYLLALGYWALREAFDARGVSLALAEWQLALVSAFGEAGHLLEAVYRGMEEDEPVNLPPRGDGPHGVSPSFAVGQVAVRFLELAGIAMLAAAAVTQAR